MNKQEKEIQEALQEEAQEQLKKGKVEQVIAFKKEGDRTVPAVIRKAEDTEKIVWNNRCKNNLALYLLEEKGKTGIAAKPCDIKAIHELLKENQLERENLRIIGIPCEGMVDEKGEEHSACEKCADRNPRMYDTFLGQPVEEKEIQQEKEELDLEERFEKWKNEFQSCIKCMACRNICPLCYCVECVFDKDDPEWMEKPWDTTDVWFMHLTRALHMAGRCIECGECERACPADLPLTSLYKKINQDIQEMYGYCPGESQDKNPLVTFDVEKDAELEKQEKEDEETG